MFAEAARHVVRWCVSSFARSGPRRGRVAVIMAGVVGALGVFAAAGLPAHAGQAPAGPTPAATPSAGSPVGLPGQSSAGAVELPGLRTRTSRTYVRRDGSMVARVWGGSVNYQDTRRALAADRRFAAAVRDVVSQHGEPVHGAVAAAAVGRADQGVGRVLATTRRSPAPGPAWTPAMRLTATRSRKHSSWQAPPRRGRFTSR